MRPLISVMVPVYNMEPYLRKCADSLLAQTYESIEVLLVDDGSRDRSGAICDEYAQRDARVRVIHRENGGISACRNTCLSAARGEYLSFVDADDWAEPDYIEALFELCVSFGARLSACNHSIIRGSRITTRFAQAGGERALPLRQACENLLYHGIPDVSPWGKLYHRSLFRALRYPEGMLYEDTYLIADVLLEADVVAFTSRPLYNYLIRPDSISRDSFKPAKMDFIAASDNLVSTVLGRFPDMGRGAVRRKAHAAMSVRRYLVGCGSELKATRDMLDGITRGCAREVLFDKKAPVRDKLGIAATLIGPRAYDALWKNYIKRRQGL